MNIKKVLGAVVFSIVASSNLSADYKLVLTDVDGNQSQECIKSYSFSNNLESIAKQNSVGKDIYSEEEVMTNKVYLGKPVYRIVSKIPNLFPSYSWKVTSYVNPPVNVDTLVSVRLVGKDYSALDANENTEWKIHYELEKDYIGYTFGSKRQEYFTNRKVILEYTKTTDSANTSSNTFRSYLHYVPSSSTTEEVITQNMYDLGVQFLKGYTYNPDTSSCEKIQ